MEGKLQRTPDLVFKRGTELALRRSEHLTAVGTADSQATLLLLAFVTRLLCSTYL